jgi:hypothetical protein
MFLSRQHLVGSLMVLTASLYGASNCSGIGRDGGTQPGSSDPCSAGCNFALLPPGDFQGKPLAEWGFNYVEWAIKTGLGGQSLPDTVGNVRYLPADFGTGDFVTDLTIQQGTSLVRSPFFIFGERYDNGSEDNPNDPAINAILQDTTIKVSIDGSVVLEGLVSTFPDRTFGVTVFPQPIPYTQAQGRGPGVNSVAALFGLGITTIYDMLPVGQHTIRDEFNSPNFFGARSFTYQVNVLPEPGSLVLVGTNALGFVTFARRRRGAEPC